MMNHATTIKDLEIRRGADRGTTDLGWLHSRHSFSFGRYHDPERIEYHTLRVLNDDIIKPGSGFAEHPHDNMEIITWVIEGALTHQDSTGTRQTLQPDEVQMMTAGSGLTHSEMNASETEPVHLLQIWILPAKRNLQPAYIQRVFPPEGRAGRWQVLISPGRDEGSLPIGQDAVLRVTDLEEGDSIRLSAENGRHTYLHVARGLVALSDEALDAGDAVAFTDAADLTLRAQASAQLLWFDLP